MQANRSLATTQLLLKNTPMRNFRQVHNLHEIVYTAQAELD